MAKILVIDDEELVRAEIAELYTEEHKVVTAENVFYGRTVRSKASIT